MDISRYFSPMRLFRTSESDNRDTGADRRPGIWIIVMLALVSLAGIANHELWTPDEPREAAIALSMRRSADFIVPMLAGEPFVEKPPLAYIASAGTLAAFEGILGRTGALRLSSALWGLGTLLVTFLLARRLAGPAVAPWAVAALAVMPGFVHVTHWLLVDNALMFFIALTVWLFSEAYLRNRPGLLPVAGVSLAAAFLVKGLIGPIIIGLVWLGLVVSLYRRRELTKWFTLKSLRFHLIAAGVALALAGVWMAGLRFYGGADLWREWFWDNHFGRFTGQARHLGHIRGPFYYVSALAVCVMLWLALWADGIWQWSRRFFRRQVAVDDAKVVKVVDEVSRPGEGVCWPPLLFWSLGGILLLTMSSTKREIYLSMLLPSFAIITALLLTRPVARWVRYYLRLWQWLALLILGCAVLAPLPAVVVGLLSLRSALGLVFAALTALVVALYLLRDRNISWRRRWFGIMALTYIMLLTVAPPILDNFKDYGPSYRNMAAAIPEGWEEKLVAWNFDETTRAGFYYYCDLVFPPVSDSVENLELYQILAGESPDFVGVVAMARNFPPDTQLPDYDIMADIQAGYRRTGRNLLLITGIEDY